MKKIVVVAVLGCAAVAFAKTHVKPGMWHLKVTAELVGAPFTPPPHEMDRCITPEQANDPEKMIKEQDKNCDPVDVKFDGNKATFKVNCHAHGGTQTGSGEIVYQTDSYTGTITADMTDPRMGHMKMIEHISGTRTGDCK